MGTARRRRNRLLGVTGVLVLTAVTGSAGYAALAGPGSQSSQPKRPQVGGGSVTFEVAGGTVAVDTASLRVTGRAGGAHVPVSGATADTLGKPSGVEVDGSRASWSYPSKGLKVTAATERGRLRITVHSAKDATLAWPVTGRGPGTGAGDASLQIPRGEGLSVPTKDRFWNSDEAGLAGTEAELATGSLTLPLWGYTARGHGVTTSFRRVLGPRSLSLPSRGS
ncbi:hypothetical protein [Streptomyces sp. NPDC048436]|uniref:hypothetical protein n=1 Tax=Streptomyces sp. NPDC048436 TaxID=3365550 RepID=UPI0037140561